MSKKLNVPFHWIKVKEDHVDDEVNDYARAYVNGRIVAFETGTGLYRTMLGSMRIGIECFALDIPIPDHSYERYGHPFTCNELMQMDSVDIKHPIMSDGVIRCELIGSKTVGTNPPLVVLMYKGVGGVNP